MTTLFSSPQISSARDGHDLDVTGLIDLLKPAVAGRRHRRRRFSRLALVGLVSSTMAATLGLSGCASNASSAPASSSHYVSLPPQHDHTSATSGSSSDGARAITGDYVLPEAAKAHTSAGAIAFVKFYWESLAKLDAKPQPGALTPFKEPACKICSDQEATNLWFSTHREHLVNASMHLSAFAVRPDSTNDEIVVTFKEDVSASTRVDSRGKIVATNKPVHLTVAARADWIDNAWKLGAGGANVS